jgi:signal peptidase I
MHPTINPNRYESDGIVLVRPTFSIRSLLSETPIEASVRRGEVVGFINPKDPEERLIKRVVGLPGDLVKTFHYKRKYVLVPEGHCWVEGDNYSKSGDSNRFGCMSMGLIQGKAKAYVRKSSDFPFISFGLLKTELPSHRRLKVITSKEPEGKEMCFVDFKDLNDPSDRFDDDFEDDDFYSLIDEEEK